MSFEEESEQLLSKCSDRFARRPVCSHEECSDFFHSPERAASSGGLYQVMRHQSSLPRVVWVLYGCRRRYRK